MLATGRICGLSVPVFSLRSATDLGVGDFGALETFLGWMPTAGQRLLMVLPLLPTAPGDPSPYATRSAFGLNPLFIDLTQVPDFAGSGERLYLTPEERERLDLARAAERVRYDLVFPLKEKALRAAFNRFDALQWAEGSEDAFALKRYCEAQRDWLDAFALFAALSAEQRCRPWWEWPEALKTRQGPALAEARERLGAEIRYRQWLQWTADEQWTKVRRAAQQHRVLLCGDEPFIIGKDSADAWTRPEELRIDARLGAPPDAFSATGQDWGLPYFDFPRMEQTGFAWLKARARNAASYFDLRRVDHAVGYFRQWVRFEGEPLGHFIPGNEHEQQPLGERNFRLLSEGAGTVAEDLGVIPPWVRETLTRLSIPGFRVLRWEKDWDTYRDPHHFPKLSLVCTGTHDTEPLKEWWEALPDSERQAVARSYAELHGRSVTQSLTPELGAGLLAAAAQAGSDLCVLPWQDVFYEGGRINLPGSMTDGNWSYRIRDEVGALALSERVRAAAERISRLVRDSGRAG